MKELKKVLINGAAGGFGTVIIEALLTRGYTITGAMRNVGGRNKHHTCSPASTLDRSHSSALANEEAFEISPLSAFGK
jgi:NAD(P)-dependent dehydrogenase (short-subunit alcohol dehydrogenase family)